MLIREGTPEDVDALVALDHVARCDSIRADCMAHGMGHWLDTGFLLTPSMGTA